METDERANLVAQNCNAISRLKTFDGRVESSALFFSQSPSLRNKSSRFASSKLKLLAGNEAGMKLKRDMPLITDRGEL